MEKPIYCTECGCEIEDECYYSVTRPPQSWCYCEEVVSK